MIRRTVTILVLAVCCSSCGGSSGPSELARFDEARAKWLATRPGSYIYHYQQSCFCVFAALPVDVQVQGESVVEVRDSDTNAIVSNADGIFTGIDGLFDRVKASIDGDAEVLHVTYDPDYGYPLHFETDGSKQVADDEFSFDAKLQTITGVACGPTTCGVGLECCNASCGICTPPGGDCIQIACE